MKRRLPKVDIVEADLAHQAEVNPKDQTLSQYYGYVAANAKGRRQLDSVFGEGMSMSAHQTPKTLKELADAKIKARAEIDQQLKERREEALKAILDRDPDGILSQEPDGRLKYTAGGHVRYVEFSGWAYSFGPESDVTWRGTTSPDHLIGWIAEDIANAGGAK